MAASAGAVSAVAARSAAAAAKRASRRARSSASNSCAVIDCSSTTRSRRASGRASTRLAMMRTGDAVSRTRRERPLAKSPARHDLIAPFAAFDALPRSNRTSGMSITTRSGAASAKASTVSGLVVASRKVVRLPSEVTRRSETTAIAATGAADAAAGFGGALVAARAGEAVPTGADCVTPGSIEAVETINIANARPIRRSGRRARGAGGSISSSRAIRRSSITSDPISASGPRSVPSVSCRDPSRLWQQMDARRSCHGLRNASWHS